MSRTSAQRGNALFIILIGIALFAALAIVVKDTGGENFFTALNTDTQRLSAAEMIQYGETLRTTLDKMISMGTTTDTTATLFAETTDTNYGTPGTAATSEIFNKSGGAALYSTVPSGACSTTCAYEFSGQIAMSGVGTDPGTNAAYDLVMLVLNVDPTVCAQINSIQGYGTTIPTGTALTLARYNGNYGTAATNQITLAAMTGKKAFCYQESTGGARYIFAYTLRAH